MESIEQKLSNWMRGAAAAAFPEHAGHFGEITVVKAGSREFGDYQCNSAMTLARLLKQKPRDIAEAIVSKLPPNDLVDGCGIAGPGFINITLSSSWLAGFMDYLFDSEYLGRKISESSPVVVMDYSSPNFAKPMHIGHIRSSVIGNALDRIHRFTGHRVVSDNHIGDWGTQCGVLIMGYKRFIDEEALKLSPIAELERIYVKSYEKTREDEAWLAACREELVKLQSGDPENTGLWQRFVDLSLGEFERIYKRLDIKFDMTRGESFYKDELSGVARDLESKGIARESEGALVCFLEEEKLPPCIVRKSDGGFNYATTDIATVVSREKEFSPEKIVYVTDERQQLHFRQIFAIAARMGVSTALQHVWFGLMRLPEGTFSTREGNVIKLELLLDEAERRALELVRECSPEMPADRQSEVARAVGIGAVKYADLSQNPQSLVTFTWEKALTMSGNSAPYLQYAHARIMSVVDKYAERFPGTDLDVFPITITEPMERNLAVSLAGFMDAVSMAGRMFKPNCLADYLYDLAGLYSAFYQNLPFLKAPEGVRESRVRLCVVTAKVLKQGLNLLGIEAPDRI